MPQLDSEPAASREREKNDGAIVLIATSGAPAQRNAKRLAVGVAVKKAAQPVGADLGRPAGRPAD